MTSSITILREKEGIEYEVLIDVSLDRDRDVEAACAETVLYKIETPFGIEKTSMILEIHGEVFEEGAEITLGEMELEDARESIYNLETAHNNFLLLSMSPC